MDYHNEHIYVLSGHQWLNYLNINFNFQELSQNTGKLLGNYYSFPDVTAKQMIFLSQCVAKLLRQIIYVSRDYHD